MVTRDQIVLFGHTTSPGRAGASPNEVVAIARDGLAAVVHELTERTLTIAVGVGEAP